MPILVSDPHGKHGKLGQDRTAATTGLRRENGVHDVEARARDDAGVVEDVDRQCGRAHLVAVQAEWRRDDVTPKDASLVVRMVGVLRPRESREAQVIR